MAVQEAAGRAGEGPKLRCWSTIWLHFQIEFAKSFRGWKRTYGTASIFFRVERTLVATSELDQAITEDDASAHPMPAMP